MRGEHYKTSTKIMDSFQDRFNAGDPPESPTDRDRHDILLQALSPKYEIIWRAHLKRRDFDLANIRRTVVAFYPDNLSRRNITLPSIAEPSAAMQTIDRNVYNGRCHNRSRFGHYRRNYPNRREHQKGGQHQQGINGRPRTNKTTVIPT